jgi:two-component system sensor histidine kinase ChvG
LWTSRLTRNIEAGLINAKVDNIQSLASTISTVIGEQATGVGGTAELDVDGARQVLRGVNVQEGWRVRLHDKSGDLVADTETLNFNFEVETLEPILEERPDRPKQDIWRENIRGWIDDKLHKSAQVWTAKAAMARVLTPMTISS